MRSGGVAARLAGHNGKVFKDYKRKQDAKAATGLDAGDLLGDEDDYRETRQVFDDEGGGVAAGLDVSDLLTTEDTEGTEV